MKNSKQCSDLERYERSQESARRNCLLNNNKYESGRSMMMKPTTLPVPLYVAEDYSSNSKQCRDPRLQRRGETLQIEEITDGQPETIYAEQKVGERLKPIYIEQQAEGQSAATYNEQRAEKKTEIVYIPQRGDRLLVPKRQMLYAEAVAKGITAGEDAEEDEVNANVEATLQNTGQNNVATENYEMDLQRYEVVLPNTSYPPPVYVDPNMYNAQTRHHWSGHQRQQVHNNKNSVAKRPTRPNPPQPFVQPPQNYNAFPQTNAPAQNLLNMINTQLHWYYKCYGPNNINYSAPRGPHIDQYVTQTEMQQQSTYYQCGPCNTGQCPYMYEQQYYYQADMNRQYNYQYNGQYNTNR